MSDSRWGPWRIRGGLSVLALLGLTAASGCAVQSELTNVWRDTSLASGSLRNVLAVGLRKDPVRRRAWEDAFVTALEARGVAATASYRLFSDAPPDTEEVIGAIRKHGYDAVLTSVRLPDESTSQYVPGAIRSEPVTTQDYYGRFHSHWVRVRDPGYTETSTITRVQTDIWTTGRRDGRLVWSSTLRTLETMDSRSVERAVSRDIMPALDKQGVFPQKGH